MGESNEQEDGIHPLDRDYTNPVPSPPKRWILSESRGLNLGILGFGVGGLVLLIGIVLSELGAGNRSFESMASSAHRFGMWSILLGGGCVIFSMQTRADKPRGKRRRDGEILHCAIVSKAGSSPFGLRDWQCALEEFDCLVVSQLTSDCLRPELEDIYFAIGGRVLAVLYWDRTQPGVIRVRLLRRDLRQVEQRSARLLEFLNASFVHDSRGFDD